MRIIHYWSRTYPETLAVFKDILPNYQLIDLNTLDDLTYEEYEQLIDSIIDKLEKAEIENKYYVIISMFGLPDRIDNLVNGRLK